MERIIADNLQCIEQAISLIERMDQSLYTMMSPQTLGAGIGGHIRHNIDHYQSFLTRENPDQIDYEDRRRDRAVETDPARASCELQAIHHSLQQLDATGLDRPIQIRVENTAPSDAGQWAVSTERRELQFLLSHSVHHYALIAMICRLQGAETPDDFGVAPSTLRYRQLSLTAECAQ